MKRMELFSVFGPGRSIRALQNSWLARSLLHEDGISMNLAIC